MGGGNDWGTHATLLRNPQIFTLALAGSDNVFTLDSHQSNGGYYHYLGTGLYVDEKAAPWTFTTTGTDGVFTINNAGNYLAGNGVNALIKTVTDNADANAKWKVISTQTLRDNMANATLDNPQNVTFLIGNHEFKRNAGVWTVKAFDGVSAIAKDKNGNDCFSFGQNGNNANCAESYHSSNGFRATQSLSGLPAGVYQLDAQAFYRKDGGDAPKPYFKMNDAQCDFPIKTGSENNMTTAYQSFLQGKYPITPLVVRIEDNGSIALEVAGERTDMWNIFGELNLTYYGDVTLAELVLKTAVANYRSALAAAKAVNQKMGTAAQTNLQEAISQYSEANVLTDDATEESLTTAQAALEAATAAARQSAAFYAKVTPWVEIYNNLDASGKAALQTATNEYVEAYGNNSLDEQESVLNNTIIPDIRIGVKAQTTEGSDFTGAIINPNFDGNINGWTDTFTGGLNHGFQNNAAYGTINQFMECWAGIHSGASAPYLLPDGKLYQTITDLPAGKYTLSADIIATQQGVGTEGYISSLEEVTGIYIFAQSNALFKSDACNKTASDADKRVSFSFNTTGGDTQVGLLIESTNCNWAVLDNVTLTYEGAPDINVNLVALQQAVNDAPDLTGVECKEVLRTAYTDALNQATTVASNHALSDQEYITAYNALMAARSAAEASVQAYANSKALRAAVEAGNAYAFDDPFAGWSLDHADNYFHKNTWSVEGDNDGSNMKTPFGEYWTAGAALADGVISYNTLGGMKKGKYAVSMLVRIYDNTGAAYDGISFNGKDITTGLTHVKYNVKNGVLNGVYGVITDIVTVAEDEGDLNFQFEVKDANASWFAWKGVTIKYLGTNETDADASLKISEAGYATYYAPFVTQIPEGVQVYTITGIEENGYTLTLAEVTGAIPANTPVLLEGSQQAETIQGVAYNTVNCGPTTGLLTGVLEKTEATMGSYILQNQNGKVGFYRVADAGLYVGANRAYLTVPEVQEVKAFFFDEATAIEAVEALASGKADIYDISGRRLQKLQKGINIVNGVKILVK